MHGGKTRGKEGETRGGQGEGKLSGDVNEANGVKYGKWEGRKYLRLLFKNAETGVRGIIRRWVTKLVATVRWRLIFIG